MGRTEMLEYYAKRAPEYDLTYERPERQADLQNLRALVRDLLSGHDVLELACGTGYWTQVIAGAARSVLATDAGPEVLSLAQRRDYLGASVSFALADAASPVDIAGEFTAALAAFWWSHLRRQELFWFVDGLRRRLGGGVRLVFLDNCYVEGNSTPIADVDTKGNSYQLRGLIDGSTYRVLKNFPEPNEVRTVLSSVGNSVRVDVLKYYWCASCTLEGSA